jgi:mono/diheme cytochrome c family protein
MIPAVKQPPGIRSLPAVAALVALSGLPVVALAADVQAGKAASQAKCVECHEADDWEGESAASLESLISDIVAGSVKHKRPLQLSSAEIADIAAYWGQSSQKGKGKRN